MRPPITRLIAIHKPARLSLSRQIAALSIIAALASGLGGCASDPKKKVDPWEEVRVGMSGMEVQKKIGPPDNRNLYDEIEEWQYLTPIWTEGVKTQVVRFQKGRVVQVVLDQPR